MTMRVFIRVPNWVGDAVMAVPALRELRRIFAEARISLVARRWVAGLFDDEGLADEIISVEDSNGFVGSTGQFISLARRLRRERFDVGVLLQNAFGAALLARAGGARKIAGYPTDHRRPLLDIVIPLHPEHKTAHQVLYYLNIASNVERHLKGESHVAFEDAQPRLEISDRGKLQASELLEHLGPTSLSRSSRILVLNPGATNSRAKRWLAERFAATADTLAERDGFQTIIVGAPGDVEAASETARRMRSSAIMLAGKTTLSQLKAVLAFATLVISNDTGAAHLSAALGTPTVVVFGPTEHGSTRPYSDVASVVRHDVECSPCMLKDCPIDHRCMTRVEVNDVYRAAKNLLVTAAR
jgi:heptosyltransferase-2